MTKIAVNSKNLETPHQKDWLNTFFENHSTTRKVVAYLPPIYFGVGAVLRLTTSYNILPGISPTAALLGIPIWFLSFAAKDCDRSLQNKKIERLN